MKKPRVIIVIPVYYGNLSELAWSIEQQVLFFRNDLRKYDWKIVIANNGLKKDILPVAKKLHHQFPEVLFHDIDIPGRGASLKAVWSKTHADVFAYMDVDLATDLHCFKDLIESILHGADLAVGSRYLRNSYAHRSVKRHILSRAYNSFFTRFLLGATFSDAQCGFKAIHPRVVRSVLPLVRDDGWFFDTELLYLCQKLGYTLHEVPVRWKENTKSGVKILRTVSQFLPKLLELRFRSL